MVSDEKREKFSASPAIRVENRFYAQNRGFVLKNGKYLKKEKILCHKFPGFLKRIHGF